MDAQNFYSVELQSKKQLSDVIWEFRFKKPADFKHLSGQFAQFQIPSADTFELRSYSISSVPEADYLEFCIKFVPGGKGSEYLSNLRIGEKLNLRGPSGLFFCKENANSKYFIATGVGLAPIIAMIESCKEGDLVDLLFGVRGEGELFWQERLENVKLKNARFSRRITLSRGSEDWKGLKGRVTEHLIIDKNGHYYICGQLEMVKDVRDLLLKNGVNTKNVHFEIF